MASRGSLTKSKKLFIYIALVFMGGAAMLIYSYKVNPNFSINGAVVFGLLLFLANNMSVSLPRAGSVSVANGLALACLFIFGPTTASMISLLELLNISDIRSRKAWYKYLFNAGQLLISITAAGFIYWLFNLNIAERFSLMLALAIFCSSLAYYLFNTWLTAIAISISEGVSPLNLWIYNFLWILPFHVIVTIIAVGVSMLYLSYGWVSLLFTVLPLILAQYIYLLSIRERKSVLENIINLVRIMEAKDEYTAGHSKRVAEYAERIARELGLNEYEVDRLKNAAYLHDAGKVQVELSVLHKKDPLTKSDWEMIKKHSTISADIARDIPITRSIADVILHHHERYDGEGYPNHISGNQIPMASCILSVADAFDAMTTKRPYRNAMILEDAIKEIMDNSGKMFNPEVVKAFLKVAEKNSFSI
ncbi:MAG: HD-GYP domain-containing protein [Actinobacteria bacterium]|nr:HD-GYP domain-containing protein [Actinomycetota bacterium]